MIKHVIARCRLFAYGSSWCRCHPKTLSSLASFKSRRFYLSGTGLPTVVLENRPLNECSNSSSCCYSDIHPAFCVLARHAISSLQFSLGLLQLEAIIYFQWVCKTPMSARLPYQSKNHSRAPVHQKVRSTDHINWMLHTHTRLEALCPGLPGSARTRKIKPIWILLKQ